MQYPIGVNPAKSMSERVDDVIREFLDFLNLQVGAYMDALAGFEGHYARVERQVHRANRAVGTKTNEKGQQVVVWASYEDPTKPDIIHNRIARAEDYLAANAKGGSNEQQHSKAIAIFIFTYWEDEVRPRLAAARGVPVEDIRADSMGDLRILRNVILHAKGVMRKEKHDELKVMKDLFQVDQSVQLAYEPMHRIFVLIKQDCLRLLGQNGGPDPSDIVGLAIQRINRGGAQ